MDSDDERSYLRAMLVITLALGILTAVVAALVAIFPGDDGPASPTPSGTETSPATTVPADVEGRSPVPDWMALPDVPDPCPEPTASVGSTAELAAALEDAGPGSVIHLADGVYDGPVVLTTPATRDDPAWLCGGPGAVVDGGGHDSGYTLHLDGASHWTVQGLTVRGGQKGVMADGVTGVTLTGLTVHSVGDEALHLRAHSADNVVAGNVLSDTGLREPEFGEGVYVGSAESNWCDLTGCEPDASDHNRIVGNVVFATTAEPVDIKEGTTGGVLAGNQLDGAAITGDVPDSWVAVKGNGWRVVDNEGRHSPGDGFQVTEQAEGWGRGNVIAGNTGRLGSEDGTLVAVVEGNTVACSNALDGPGRLSDAECTERR